MMSRKKSLEKIYEPRHASVDDSINSDKQITIYLQTSDEEMNASGDGMHSSNTIPYAEENYPERSEYSHLNNVVLA